MIRTLEEKRVLLSIIRLSSEKLTEHLTVHNRHNKRKNKETQMKIKIFVAEIIEMTGSNGYSHITILALRKKKYKFIFPTIKPSL